MGIHHFWREPPVIVGRVILFLGQHFAQLVFPKKAISLAFLDPDFPSPRHASAKAQPCSALAAMPHKNQQIGAKLSVAGILLFCLSAEPGLGLDCVNKNLP